MDNIKIGNFIRAERKSKNLTQAKLAEKLFVSEKTISKWENGKGIPDTEVLSKLCEVLGISVNELLNGDRIAEGQYEKIAESKLLDLQKVKEISDKRLLSMEIVIGVLSIIILLSFTMFASYLEMASWLRVVIIVIGFIVALVGVGFALRIEQVAGFYVCKHCKHKFVPDYNQVLWAAHINRTRYLKCPKCNKKSWAKKVVK